MQLPPGAHLTREEDFDVRKLKGTAVYTVLNRLIALPGYQQLPDDKKAEVLDRAIEKTRGTITQKVKPIIKGRILSAVGAAL